jgi:hypothetical protein
VSRRIGLAIAGLTIAASFAAVPAARAAQTRACAVAGQVVSGKADWSYITASGDASCSDGTTGTWSLNVSFSSLTGDDCAVLDGTGTFTLSAGATRSFAVNVAGAGSMARMTGTGIEGSWAAYPVGWPSPCYPKEGADDPGDLVGMVVVDPGNPSLALPPVPVPTGTTLAGTFQGYDSDLYGSHDVGGVLDLTGSLDGSTYRAKYDCGFNNVDTTDAQLNCAARPIALGSAAPAVLAGPLTYRGPSRALLLDSGWSLDATVFGGQALHCEGFAVNDVLGGLQGGGGEELIGTCRIAPAS